MIQLQDVFREQRAVDGWVHLQIRVGRLEVFEILDLFGSDGSHRQRQVHLLIDVAEQPVEPAHHHRRSPFARSDAEHLELGRQQRGIFLRLRNVGIDPVHERLDDGRAARVIPVELLVQIAAIHKQAVADVALEFSRPQNFGHRASGLPPPQFELEQTVVRDVVTLGEEEVSFILGVNMGDAPAIFQDFDRLA